MNGFSPIGSAISYDADLARARRLMPLVDEGLAGSLSEAAIRFAISHYRGQMSEVARRLRIGRSTLYRKLDSLGLAADSPDLDAPAL